MEEDRDRAAALGEPLRRTLYFLVAGTERGLTRDQGAAQAGVARLVARQPPRSVPIHTAMPRRTGERPRVPPGYPIGEYSDGQLLSLAMWIRSDGILRTEEELLDEMMSELGFQRRGKNVVARVTDAIRRSGPETRRPHSEANLLRSFRDLHA